MPCALPLMNGWKEKERAGIVPQPDARPTLAQREPAARMPLDAMTPDPDFLERLRAELRSGRRWLDRAIVLGYAIVAGLAIVGISIASDWAFGAFHWFFSRWPWAVLIVTPLLTGGIVWATLRFFPGAAVRASSTSRPRSIRRWRRASKAPSSRCASRSPRSG